MHVRATFGGTIILMNEFLDNDPQANPTGDEWEKAMQEFTSRFQPKEKPESTPRYEYMATDVEDIIKNAEEYIIPECLEACRALWDKNIETVMCANYNDNNNLYIDLVGDDGLSNENKEIFIANEGSGFRLGEEHDYPRISVPDQTPESAVALKKLVDKLKIQDVRNSRHQSSEEFLEEFRYGDMPAEYVGVDDHGNVIVDRQYDPKRINATLEEALRQTGKVGLYVPSEDRVYKSQLFLDWHNRYLKSKE